MMGSATNKTEANNGGEEYSDDVYHILEQEHGYSINTSHKKAPTNMAKLTRIEQHAPTISNFYFRDSHSRDDDYSGEETVLIENLKQERPFWALFLLDAFYYNIIILTKFRKYDIICATNADGLKRESVRL